METALGLMRNTTQRALLPQLQLALIKDYQNKKSHLEQGFTLVELMIVIVIVGILSAVALPNFLSQTEKAKATEAKSSIAAILKQAQAQFQEDGAAPAATAALQTDYNAPANGTTKFNYSSSWSDPVYTITATGNSTDSAIDTTKTLVGCADFDTGVVEMQTNFSSTAPTCT